MEKIEKLKMNIRNQINLDESKFRVRELTPPARPIS